MRENRIITLLTDFGLQDPYVGILKGVIAQINPQLSIIDLTHQIGPQNVYAGRFCLMNAYSYFPMGTIHVAVVDPGVGSQRRAIAVQFAQGYLIGPDNGLFSGVLSISPVITAVTLTNTDYWRTPNSSFTFHGRDIFAPVAAYLASGVPLQMLGEVIDTDSLQQLPITAIEVHSNKILGTIQYIDIYGNLITNIPASAVNEKIWSVELNGQYIYPSQAYSDVTVGELVTLVGSHGWVEIAVNRGNAQDKLQFHEGDQIIISVRGEGVRG